MPWVKGQSGNPGGRPKLDSRVSALAKKESPAIFKKLVRIANGKPATEKGDTPSNTEILRAMDMVFDRAWGRPTIAESGGAFEGATINVDTGFGRHRIEPPTIDATPVDQDQPAVYGTNQSE
jgi:hypothetical protein